MSPSLHSSQVHLHISAALHIFIFGYRQENQECRSPLLGISTSHTPIHAIAAPLQILFHAPVDAMVPYFDRNGYTCPTYTNPADYLFREVSGSWGGLQEMWIFRVVDLRGVDWIAPTRTLMPDLHEPCRLPIQGGAWGPGVGGGGRPGRTVGRWCLNFTPALLQPHPGSCSA